MSSPIQNEVSSVFIHVNDLKKAAEWYYRLFQLPGKKDGVEGPIYSLDTTAGARLKLYADSSDPDYRSDPSPKVLFNLQVTDIHAANRFMQEHEINIVSAIRSFGNISYFLFQDLDGNIVMAIQEGDARGTESGAPILRRINSVFIQSHDMKRSIEWYCELLGQPIKPGTHTHIYDIRVKGATGITIVPDDHKTPPEQKKQVLFHLGADDIPSAYQHVLAKGGRIVKEIESFAGNPSFTFRDPDGKVLMVSKTDGK